MQAQVQHGCVPFRALLPLRCKRRGCPSSPNFPEWSPCEKELVEAHDYGSIQHAEGARGRGYTRKDRNVARASHGGQDIEDDLRRERTRV